MDTATDYASRLEVTASQNSSSQPPTPCTEEELEDRPHSNQVPSPSLCDRGLDIHIRGAPVWPHKVRPQNLYDLQKKKFTEIQTGFCGSDNFK